MLVSNSSTLILLARINVLRLFLDEAQTILIPTEVQEEVMSDKITYDALLIQKEIGARIVVQKVTRPVEQVQKQFRLDRGEAAAYALYVQEQGTGIMTDDRELIKLCKLEGIKFLCAIAIVTQLYRNKKLSQQETLLKMDKLGDIGRYSSTIINHFRKEVQ